MEQLRRTIKAIGPLDGEAMRQAEARQGRLTKPPGSLGRLEELSIRIAGITGRVTPPMARKLIAVMAADHGVVESGVSAYPQEVTAQMAANFLRGGAGINVLSRYVGARVSVTDVGIKGPVNPLPGLRVRRVAEGTGNISRGPAMSREQAVQALETGVSVIEEELSRGIDILGTGDMGIGNTTPSSAITAALTGRSVEEVTGRGTGVDDAGLARKREAITMALSVNAPDPGDALDVLSKVGGFEIGAIAGAILAAAAARVPVVIDGFISGAGALIACGLAPAAREYLIASHLSAEGGHRHCLGHLGLVPLLDLGLRLGEGTGAALAMFLAESAVRLLAEMATFEEAGVSDAEAP